MTRDESTDRNIPMITIIRNRETPSTSPERDSITPPPPPPHPDIVKKLQLENLRSGKVNIVENPCGRLNVSYSPPKEYPTPPPIPLLEEEDEDEETPPSSITVSRTYRDSFELSGMSSNDEEEYVDPKCVNVVAQLHRVTDEQPLHEECYKSTILHDVPLTDTPYEGGANAADADSYYEDVDGQIKMLT